MNDESTNGEAENRERPRLKIQDNVPIRTVGIETERERKNYSDLPPQNYIHVWWARRPTPATRLSILSSVLPDTVDDDTLLRWIGIDPDNKESGVSIAEHVRQKKRTEDDRDGFVYEHYGYRKAYKNLPNEEEMAKLHDTARETWGGELPTVLDATAGGGSIPFESVRYGFPTIANELNPVASIVLKAVLEHPRVDGDLSDDIREWGGRINEYARRSLSKYFPTREGEKTLEYLWANTLTCPDCGLIVPLSPNWWLDKQSASEGVAAMPEVVEDSDEVEFSIVELPTDTTKSEFNPTDGTVSRGKATCPGCDVVIDGEEVKNQARNAGFGHQLYAVHAEHESKNKNGGRYFRAPNENDRRACSKANKELSNSPEFVTFLDKEIPAGNKTDEPRRYGITTWRDMYSPRQLLVHYTYWQAFEKVKEEVRTEYSEDVSDAILTFLAIAADKALDYNNRLSIWHPSRAVIGHLFSRHDFAFAWSFAESNLTAEGLGYEWALENIVGAYEDLRDLSGHSDAPVDVHQGDAAAVPLDTGSVQAVVLDPPYYDNVMYAELSDFFYVWLGKYLGDVYPEFFVRDLTDKHAEAVANPAKFNNIADEGQSKRELAKRDYEEKMTNLFEEMYRLLDTNGVFTLMFTHKQTEAWDTLTKALIESGFVVKATHPVSTESPYSLHQAGKNAAESTILLTSEKRQGGDDEFTLWDDVKEETRRAAWEKARDLDEREVEFTKVDMILASFGPTLSVFTENYPVVDDEGEEISPQRALDEARTAVSDYLIEHYLNEGIRDVDPKTEWYVLAWLVFEAQRFPYDEARRLAIGVGEDLDALKKKNRMWRKRSGDIVLRPHDQRVQNVNKDRSNRSGRLPVDPDALSFSTALDKVHAAMHVQDAKGDAEAWNWLNERNCASDPAFKATLEALLRVLPHDNDDWKLARDLASGETGKLLDLELDANIFRDDVDAGPTQENLGSYGDD